MITFNQVTITAGDFALRDLSFSIDSGEYAVLMGRTGCGKTTILEAICGFRTVDRGSIVLDDIDVTYMRPSERGIGYVPQDGALFAKMTVYNHLAFALRIRKWHRSLIADRVLELAALLGINELLHRKPQGLSGGEKQRVALGRALSFGPSTLILDEPLSALDDETRAEMIDLLKRVQREIGFTAIHVTHNRLEGRQLADRLFRIKDGSMVEIEGKGADDRSMG